jgi:glyoxylase-like metal-dependent hydrolase (beta-lactamase superfamily II)
MKVKAYGQHLFQLTHLGAINCFLVREDDGFTLVDTAWPESQARAIVGVADKLGFPIVRIALTHAHIDHVGSLDALHALLPDIEVAISEREARLLAGDLRLEPSEPQGGKVGAYPCKTKPAHLLHEGERVGSLEVIATPGHCPGHIAFLDSRDRTLIAGDAFQTLGGVAVSGTFKILFPLPAMSNWDKGLSLESARKLLTYRPTAMAVGHGRLLSDPLPAMERAIHDMEQSQAREIRKQLHGA